MTAIIFFHLLVLIVDSTNARSAVKVITKDGNTIYGQHTYWKKGSNIVAFLGIPYAEPPLGDLRFKKPEPVSDFKSSYRAANEWPRNCYQNNEDCLYLNIFVPDTLKKDVKLPVVIWIHGGAFEYGTGNKLRPLVFMRHRNLIFVTIEYRLGALGFLYAGIPEAPGNMGLMDQQMALRWIKDNIRSFGGDSDKITLMGFSAGSASIHHQMLSEGSKGLFHQAIMVSGAATSAFAYTRTEEMMENFKNVAEYFNCSSKETVERVRCLRGLPAEEFSKVHRALPKGIGLHPTTDGTFLSDAPIKLRQVSIPIVTVANRDEGLGWSRHFFDDDVTSADDVREKARSKLRMVPADSRREIIDEYFNDSAMEGTYGAQNAGVNLMSDFINLCPIWFLGSSQSKSVSPVYRMIFNYFYKKADEEWDGHHRYIDHVSVHPYIYGLAYEDENTDGNEKKLAERTTDMFIKFVTEGKISEDKTMNEATANNGFWIEINLKEDNRKRHWPREENCRLWNQLKKQEDENQISMFQTRNLVELRRFHDWQKRRKSQDAKSAFD